MIPFKKKPNSIVKYTAVILILLCFTGASFGFVDDYSKHTIEDSRVSSDDYDRRVSAKDESERISVDLERKSTVASPYIRDVRADSRQSRIDARDIRTDFREIRTELRNAQRERNVRDIRAIRDQNSPLGASRQRSSPNIRDIKATSRQSRFYTRDIRTDSRKIRTESRETQINKVGETNIRDVRAIRDRNTPLGASRQNSSPNIRDVRADSREPRIKSRDIRTDSREMRTKLPESTRNHVGERNIRDVRAIRDRNSPLGASRQRSSPNIRDIRAISHQSRMDTRDIRTDSGEMRTKLPESQKNRVRETNVRDIRAIRDQNSRLNVLRDTNNNIRSRESTRNVRDISDDRRSGRNVENSRNLQSRTEERRIYKIRNMRRQAVRESTDRTLKHEDVRADSRNSRDVIKSPDVRRDESRVSQRERREYQPRVLEQRRGEEGRHYNNRRASDAAPRINKVTRDISRDHFRNSEDLTERRVFQRDLLQQDRSQQPRHNNNGRLEIFRIAKRDLQSNNRNDLSRSNRDSRDRLLERSRDLKSRVLQRDSLQAERRDQLRRPEPLRERQNNVQRSENFSSARRARNTIENSEELRSRVVRRDVHRLEDSGLSRTLQRRMSNYRSRREASGREREANILRQKREIAQDSSRTNQNQSRRVQERREDSERISREAFRTSEQRRVLDNSRETMARDQHERENVRESRQTRRNEKVDRRGRMMSEVRAEIKGSETRKDADFQRELRNLQLRDTRMVDSRNIEFIPNFKEKTSMLMNTFQIIIGVVLLGQIFLDNPKNKIGFASVQNLFGKEKLY